MKITKKPAVALLLAMGMSSLPSRAAELFYMDHDTLTTKYTGADGPLVISGDIVPGDYERLLARIAENEARYLKRNQLILASDEGDVQESLRIATLVTALHSQVVVDTLTGKCVGACFLIFAAAGERVTDGPALIGVRRLPGAAAFLRDNLVPESLVTEAAEVAGAAAQSSQVYWLSDQDEKSLGSRSPAFAHYLKMKCGWDDAVEREVMLGRRAFAEMRPLLACRERVIRADAQRALANAPSGAKAAPGLKPRR